MNMKKDLFTYGLLAVIGVIVAYFVCNLFLPPFSETSFKVLTSDQSYTLADPNPEIFNFRAINPTVEGIINCEEYGSGDTCENISNTNSDEENDTTDETDETDETNDLESLLEEIFEEGNDNGNPD